SRARTRCPRVRRARRRATACSPSGSRSARRPGEAAETGSACRGCRAATDRRSPRRGLRGCRGRSRRRSSSWLPKAPFHAVCCVDPVAHRAAPGRQAVGRHGVDLLKDAEMLARVPLFSGMSPAERKLLVFTGQVLCFGDGETLMRQGEPADCAYVILEGNAEVLAETAGDSFVVAMLGPHSMPGEIGVLINEPRTATVRAKGKVRALRISPDVFVRLAT